MSSAEVPFERRFPGKWMEFYSAEELSIQERLVWRTINEYQWSNEDAWPSYRTLGRVCGIGGRQVQRIVKSLERKGLLWITHNKKRGHSNRYRCLIPENMGDRRQEYYDMINGVVPELSGGHPEDVTRTRGVTLVTPVTDMDDVPSTMSATYRYDVDVAPGVTPIAAERTKEGVRKGSGNGSGESSLRSPTRTQDPNPKTIPNPIPETLVFPGFRGVR